MDNIDAVIQGVSDYLHDIGLSPGTIKPYQRSLDKLRRFYDEAGVSDYSVDLSNKYAALSLEECSNNKISHSIWLSRNRIVYLANEYFQKGAIDIGSRLAVPKKRLPALSPMCQRLLDSYASHLRRRSLRETSIRTELHNSSVFLHYIEEKGITDLSQLTNEDVSGAIPYIRKSRKDTGHVVGSARRFLEYLVGYGGLDECLPKALYVRSNAHKKAIYGFTLSEADRLVNAADRSTAIGKRDFAIMTLARQTGLRACDIRNLRLADIKWDLAEIHIIQSKTQKPLILPLMKNVGDAVSDYILNARPPSREPFVFLSSKKPYAPLASQLAPIVKKYAAISGIDQETRAAIGMHGFRRGIGVAMLESDVPLSTISEVLGHERQNTTKKYLAIDTKGLQMCAMPMQGFQNREGKDGPV